METIIGSISEYYGQVLVLLLVLDMTQLVMNRVQVLEVGFTCAHSNSEVL